MYHSRQWDGWAQPPRQPHLHLQQIIHLSHHIQQNSSQATIRLMLLLIPNLRDHRDKGEALLYVWPVTNSMQKLRKPYKLSNKQKTRCLGTTRPLSKCMTKLMTSQKHQTSTRFLQKSVSHTVKIRVSRTTGTFSSTVDCHCLGTSRCRFNFRVQDCESVYSMIWSICKDPMMDELQLTLC